MRGSLKGNEFSHAPFMFLKYHFKKIFSSIFYFNNKTTSDFFIYSFKFYYYIMIMDVIHLIKNENSSIYFPNI